jgi:hypothetical protein
MSSTPFPPYPFPLDFTLTLSCSPFRVNLQDEPLEGEVMRKDLIYMGRGLCLERGCVPV